MHSTSLQEQAYKPTSSHLNYCTGKILSNLRIIKTIFIINMSTNNTNDIPDSFIKASPQPTPEPTSKDVSHVLRLLGLPELRLDSFRDKESLVILTAIQKYSGHSDAEFIHILTLPTLICQAHQAVEAAETELFEKFSELGDAENEVNTYPEGLDYDDNNNDDKYKDPCPGMRFSYDLPRLDSLTHAMREAHVCAAESREQREILKLQYLGMWLNILAESSVSDAIHEDFHEAGEAHMARKSDVAEACWLRDAHRCYKEDWDDGMVWDFIRDGRTALDLLISRGAIVLSGGMGNMGD